MTAASLDGRPHYHRHFSWAMAVRGLFSIAVGVFILIWPLVSVAAFAFLIACWALLVGAVDLIHAFQVRRAWAGWWILVIRGVISLAFGMLALIYYPVLSLAFAILWVAWWLVFTGGTAIWSAVLERRFGVEWHWTMLWGIAAVVVGVLALWFAPATLTTIIALIAAFALVSGLFQIIAAWRANARG